MHFLEFWFPVITFDCLCGLVVRVPGYRSRGPEFDSRHYQIFWEVVGLERGPLSHASTIEELLGKNNKRLQSRKQRIRPWESVVPTAWSWALIESWPVVQSPRVHYCVHESPPLVPMLSQANPIHTIPSILSKIHPNIIHLPTYWSS
jgi:hypothetical protein